MQVEIWKNVVGPDCHVGRRRFEASLAASPQRVDATRRSFGLDLDAPSTLPSPVADPLSATYRVLRERAGGMPAHLAALAAGRGSASQPVTAP
jgi:predicted DsbA family dithiol-disulfide isomerase